ncbi:MAG: ATP-binding protein [Candidatus Hodarchaeota archaeon]
MIISVASGKGGTGKTLIATNLTSVLENTQILDCDVEEPNDHLFLKPIVEKTIPVYIKIPVVDEIKCDYCGKCSEVCERHAIAVLKNKVLIFEELCNGCGACSLFCPRDAISERKKELGVVEVGKSGQIDCVTGHLNVGLPLAPPIIDVVKKQINPDKLVIIDSPPGTSCPVIASIYGSDFCILVTEPTPFGLFDLKLAVGVVKKLGIPFGVVINQADIGDKKVNEYCVKEGIPILLKIPWDRKIAELYSKGHIISNELPKMNQQFQMLFENVRSVMK